MQSNYFKVSVIFLSLLLSVSFTSCSSDDDGGSGGTAAAGTITAIIDGSNYQSSAMLSSANKVNQGGTTTFTLLGNSNEGKTINFVVQGYEGTGTYEIGGDNLISVTASYIEVNTSNPSQSETYVSPYDDTVSGTISFSSDENDNVQGTFEFTAQSGTGSTLIEVTDGSFNMDYTTF